VSNALTNALAAIDAYPGNGDGDALIRAKCRALLAGYHERWKDEGYTALSVEQVYTSELWNPATNGKSRTFEVAGKIDVYAERRGQRFIIDHKTTSDEIDKPDASYFQQLKVEAQVTHYMLLMWLNGEKPDGAIWDVIRKPSIAPRELKAGEIASVVSTGKWYGREVAAEYRMQLAGKQAKRETLEMYEARLASDCTTERPERYFQRRAVPRMDREILEYAEDLWQHSQDILADRKVARLPKNSTACMQWGSPCQFLGLCSGQDTPDSDKWQSRAVRHPELGEHGHIDALTNSRIKTRQSCAVKHRLQYEIGLERQDQEKESLWFGSLLHAGLEVYWQSFLEKDHGNSDTAAAAATSTS
jgi:hypothetical protein